MFNAQIINSIFLINCRVVDALIEDIVNLPIQYQQYIMDLKKQGYFIIGYCRKSRTTADNEKVTKCLQSMVLGLKERSLAQKVYVTVSCNAGTPLKKRDIKKMRFWISYQVSVAMHKVFNILNSI